jgi:Trypsin
MVFRGFAVGAACVALVALVTLGAGAGTARAAHDRYAAGSQPASLTPANQPALDAAADEARAIAGAAYYANAVIDDNANTVTVYLAHAPQAVVDRRKAAHPGTYVIENTAAFSEAVILKLEDAVSGRIPAWAAAGVRIGSLRPTIDGHLEVGVWSDVAVAASRLGAQYGNAVRVVVDTELAHPMAWRYNDTSPWNGGDFIYHNYVSCSSGIPVHDKSNGTNYMLTASHCFYGFGGVSTSVRNGYIRADTGAVYSGSSTTLIGSVTKNDYLTPGSTTQDVALIQTATSRNDFVAAWNSQGYGVQIDRTANRVGDQVCQSGAFDGQICGGIVIRALHVMKPTLNPLGYVIYVKDLVEAYNSTSGTVALGAGDSGGPVYSYSGSQLLARGMTDLGDVEVPCTSIPTGWSGSGRKCYHTLYFVDMDAIDSARNLYPNS